MYNALPPLLLQPQVVRAHLGWDYAATSDQLQGLLQESQAMIDRWGALGPP